MAEVRMKSRSIVISVLAVVLVGSNLWWFDKSVEASVIYGYRQESLLAHRSAVAQLTAVAVAAAQTGATRDSVLAAASAGAGGAEPKGSGEWAWVGAVSYRFDEGGRLAEVRIQGLRQ
jgi:hypothetical protein